MGSGQGKSRRARTSPKWESELHDFGAGAKVLAAKHGIGGGWVAATAQVDSTVYVGEDAVVFGRAELMGNARVEDHACVFGTAFVCENARITDYASVSGHAYVAGHAVISFKARVFGKANVDGYAKVGGTDRKSTRLNSSHA